jgi:hypothetical protein
MSVKVKPWKKQSSWPSAQWENDLMLLEELRHALRGARLHVSSLPYVSATCAIHFDHDPHVKHAHESDKACALRVERALLAIKT